MIPKWYSSDIIHWEPQPHFRFLYSLFGFGVLYCCVVDVSSHAHGVHSMSWIYFRLLIVFTAISINPSLASLSGKSLMLWMAFSA